LRAEKKVVRLLPQVRLRHLPSVWQSRRQLRRLLDEIKFDIVITHSPWVQSIFGGVAREDRLPLVFWMHGPFDGHWLQRLASFTRPDFAICNSRWTQSTLARFYPRLSSEVVYAPVAPASVSLDRNAVRDSLGLAEEEIVILIAARMEAWKGHLDLLRALKPLGSAHWKLLIAGAPSTSEERAYYELLQHEAAVPELAARVQFLGFRCDIPALLGASDIYCQPNREPEPFGIVFVEAMHAGVPVITSALGGAQEILDTQTGILVTPNDGEGLSRELARLIGDRELRERLGSAGPARARELCDRARQMRMLSETLQAVIECYRGTAG
jgi:glycosyltransferase involved in cell wall biosynthesis